MLVYEFDTTKYIFSLKFHCSFDVSRQSGELAQTLLSYSRQVASAIAYLHFKKYVHRDLAARNVLVSVEGICKV